MYLLKLAARPWRLALASQLFTAVAVGVLLFMAGFLLWFERGLGGVVTTMRSEQVLTVYLDSAVDQRDESGIVDSIRTSLGAHAEVRLVAPQQFVDEIRDRYPGLTKEIEDLGSEMTLVVPKYVSVSGVLPAGALDSVKTIKGVESAESSKDKFRHIVDAFGTLRWVARGITLALAAALVTGLMQLARLNSHLHGDTLRQLRLWGAGALTVRIPAILSGLWTGAAGGVLAASVWLAGALWLARHVKALSPMMLQMSPPPLEAALVLFAAGAVAGLAGGLVFGARGGHSRGRA
ncbi:MAG: hypothetical protein A2583_16110 [Bdellovibrionales bacterium RIFOXYD1_FULL_53_11]|nr:MAG: hypothetical protein A2583_16110 [Bdellovibrionales bacterium RIFOXYD1_FULL_53_11]